MPLPEMRSMNRRLSLEYPILARRAKRLLFVGPDLYLRAAVRAGNGFRRRHVLNAGGAFLLLSNITVPHVPYASLPALNAPSGRYPIS